MRLLTCVLLLASCLALAACGERPPEEEGGGEAAAATEPAQGTTSLGEISDDLTQKPEIPKPTGDPPTTLQTEDVVEGTGPAAKAGDTVAMQYVGDSWSTGEQFDASWDRGEPFTFALGSGGVIAGWDQGIVGMKQGGRRLLIIPPDLGYGPAGQGPIAPNETLVFVVDLEQIQ
jgi:peptidylprolyl isomerase